VRGFTDGLKDAQPHCRSQTLYNNGEFMIDGYRRTAQLNPCHPENKFYRNREGEWAGTRCNK